MRTVENQCVGCETCTLGSGCSLLRVEVFTCDVCGDDADYHIGGKDYCEECENKYLNDRFDELAVTEKAEVLDINCTRLD